MELSADNVQRMLDAMSEENATSRLVVVSNRVPAHADNPGGLAVALKDALAERDSVWFGWSGEVSPDPADEVKTVTRDRTTFAVVDLSEAEHAGYYAGYSNRALWPTFHYRIDLGVFSDSDFEAYMAVNRRFARHLMSIIEPGDLIWIHDYHLIPLARCLRDEGVANPIGFFSHIPFPAPEMFQAIPQHKELARGFMACNLIGFQSRRDRANFERYIIEKAAGAWMPDGRVSTHGAVARAMAFPIAIDTGSFQEAATTQEANDLADRLRAAYHDRSWIIGVDRMDYSKGLVERLASIEALFHDNEDLRGKTTFVQIAPVSRGEVEAYAHLRTEIETLVGHINGEFAQIDWAPVHYMAQGVPREQLAGLMRLARVGLVTPLRDGMNLVAKEFVAAQDPEDPGVLVLSEFAGAAEQLTDALIVNPHDTRDQADKIRKALDMPLAERRSRHSAMMDVMRRYNSSWWCSSFLQELERVRDAAANDKLRNAVGEFVGDHSPYEEREPSSRPGLSA